MARPLTGSIHQTGDKFRVRFRAGGRCQTIGTFDTFEEAEKERLAALERYRVSGHATGITMDSVSDRWFATLSHSDLAYQTAADLEGAWRIRISPIIGHKHPDRVTGRDIADILTGCGSYSQANKCRQVLMRFFEYAPDMGWMTGENPVLYREPRAAISKRRREKPAVRHGDKSVANQIQAAVFKAPPDKRLDILSRVAGDLHLVPETDS